MQYSSLKFLNRAIGSWTFSIDEKALKALLKGHKDRDENKLVSKSINQVFNDV